MISELTFEKWFGFLLILWIGLGLLFYSKSFGETALGSTIIFGTGYIFYHNIHRENSKRGEKK
jgi:hypothetical protein